MSNAKGNKQAEYRKLPSVDLLLRAPEITETFAIYGKQRVTEAVRAVLASARTAIDEGGSAPEKGAWRAQIENWLEHSDQSGLRGVVNATGVIVHTNLGRAPLSRAARQAVNEIGIGYSNLEYDLDAGERGNRYGHACELLCELTGAEDALVVNNNAAAVYLVLTALCAGREVVVSRGQLVEIGGGFRIPDVLRQSGAQLVEVGTTNRTHPHDFDRAVTDATAAFMRIHSSNFKQIGFVTEPSLHDLAHIAHAHRQADGSAIWVIDDLGSGSLLDTQSYGLAREPMVQDSIAAGADLVTFSGDKLLGGPQAGIVVGRKELVERLKRHPMARALRVDKMTLSALDATLRSYQRGHAVRDLPTWQMIAADAETLRTRVEQWREQLAPDCTGCGAQIALWPGESTIGGGSLPGETLPTHLLALQIEGLDRAAARLRAHEPPVVCRIQREHLVFDPRTVLLEQDADLVRAIRALLHTHHH